MIETPHIPLRILCAQADQSAESDCACAYPDVNPPALPGSLIITGLNVDAGRAESDCACAAAGPNAPTPVPGGPVSVWRRPDDLYLAPLPDDHTLAFNPRHPGPVSVLNPPARRLLDSFGQPHTLEHASTVLPDSPPDEAVRAAFQLAALALLAPVSDHQYPISNPQYPIPDTARHAADNLHPAFCILPSPLTAWLHLTNACNLRCVYCYVTKSGEEMDEATGLAAVDAVFRSAVCNGYRAVKLKYAGGEPTLNFGLVRTLHEHAVGLAEQHGLALQEVLLSNGVALTEAMLDYLEQAGIRLMLSLDGLGPGHDAQRPRADGMPSSGTVVAAVELALARGLIPHISVTVSPANAATLADTVRFLLERDLPFNLNFVREKYDFQTLMVCPGLARPGRGANPSGLEAQLVSGLLAACAVIEEKLPRRRLIDGLLDRSSFAGAHAYPCAAGRDYLAIDPRGRVARCHMTLDRPAGDVWAEDPLQIVRRSDAEPRWIPVERREGCRTCAWRYLCGGGCPLMADQGEGRSPYCNIYRALFPELLRLEGLRILKWGGTAVA